MVKFKTVSSSKYFQEKPVGPDFGNQIVCHKPGSAVLIIIEICSIILPRLG